MGGMGGMGGGMGGMGGGMFAVPDDSAKSKSASPLARKSAKTLDVVKLVDLMDQASEEQRLDIDEQIRKYITRRNQVAEAYLEAQDVPAAKQEFEKVIEVVNSLLSAGYPQPWMYHALALSMEACELPARRHSTSDVEQLGLRRRIKIKPSELPSISLARACKSKL